ncbi:aldo/keto reductase [Rosenbergiella epipactidis]|uniref:aldo/keto reductase n=1 Tax=Rosenbergiella epipactidis TaxID=1544694 RepID=UPI001F4E7E71
MNIFNQKVVLGAWAWGSGIAGGDQVFGNSLTEEELRPVFERAFEKKLTFWDTAAVYGMGDSERILGTFVKDKERKDFFISTKFTPQIAGNSEHPAEVMLDESMVRLNIDYVDIYWIHNNADVKRWTPELISLAKNGKIKNIGVSNHNLDEIKQANDILKKEGLKISAVQNHYSLLHRYSEKNGIIDYCKDNDIVFFSYMILEQGALSGKYNSNNPFPKKSQRAFYYNDKLPRMDKLINILKEIADGYKVSVAQIVTAWAIYKGTLPIIGVTSVEQVDDILNATEISLSQSDIKKIEDSADNVSISTVREWES